MTSSILWSRITGRCFWSIATATSTASSMFPPPRDTSFPTAITERDGEFFLGNLNIFPIEPNFARILTLSHAECSQLFIPGLQDEGGSLHIVSSKAGFTTVVWTELPRRFALRIGAIGRSRESGARERQGGAGTARRHHRSCGDWPLGSDGDDLWPGRQAAMSRTSEQRRRGRARSCESRSGKQRHFERSGRRNR